MLTIPIHGHIDSSKAQQMQEEINAAIEAHHGETDELVLDAEELTFISSLGLRCILMLKKKWTNMQVINCSEEVYNAFKLTGFTRMITITKALPRIREDELQPMEGIKDVFRLSDETMVRVFPRENTLEDVQSEVQLAREVFIWGVPTVMTFDIVRVRDSYGIIFESVEWKDMDASTLGELLRDFHQHIIEPDKKIPSALQMEKQRIKDKAEQKGDEQISCMLRVLGSIPEGSALLHGNLSLRSAAYSQDGTFPVVVSLDSIAYGNPILDIVHLYASLPQEQQAEYFDNFLSTYYDNETEAAIERIKQNILALAKAYRCWDEDITDCWDEIFSNLHFKMDFAERIRELERERFYLDCGINIDWVANALGTNRHYVSDYFNKVQHTTFSEYINNLRLEYSTHLLRRGRVQLSDIAFSAGFNSDHTFRRLFKQKYGCTPTQYVDKL